MKKNFYLDILLIICILVCGITGIVLDFHLFGGMGRAGKNSSRISTPGPATSCSPPSFFTSPGTGSGSKPLHASLENNPSLIPPISQKKRSVRRKSLQASR